MRAYFFTEDAYPYLPPEDTYESVRVNFPNKHCDPLKVAELYDKYLDLWTAADEIGLEIMNNEHHQTITCMVPSANLILAILAKRTKRARLLILGNPIANRNQPMRVAEEMAMLDCLSHGRLDCGFVRGVPYEISAANISAFRGSERLWEAHDLIKKAWTSHDGPVNFEGRFYHHRQINIWPRPYQQPHPPVWVTMGSGPSADPVAKNKYTGAVFLAGYGGIRPIFDGYQAAYKKHHGTHAPLDRLAYCALVYVSDSEKAAKEGAEELIWYITANKVAEQWKNPPGYFPPQVAGQMMKTASKHAIQSIGAAGGIDQFGKTTPDEQVLKGNMMYGTPDQVYGQLKKFFDYTGGFGNLLIMGQAGFLSYENTVKSMQLFNDHVYPRLKELTAKWDPEEAMAKRDQVQVPKSNRDYEDFSVDFVRKVS